MPQHYLTSAFRGVRCLNLFERTEKYVIIKPFRLLFRQCSIATFFLDSFTTLVHRMQHHCSIFPLPHYLYLLLFTSLMLCDSITKCALLFAISTFYCLSSFCHFCFVSGSEKIATKRPDEIS